MSNEVDAAMPVSSKGLRTTDEAGIGQRFRKTADKDETLMRNLFPGQFIHGIFSYWPELATCNSIGQIFIKLFWNTHRSQKRYRTMQLFHLGLMPKVYFNICFGSIFPLLLFFWSSNSAICCYQNSFSTKQIFRSGPSSKIIYYRSLRLSIPRIGILLSP